VLGFVDETSIVVNIFSMTLSLLIWMSSSPPVSRLLSQSSRFLCLSYWYEQLFQPVRHNDMSLITKFH
jgi:hypothetical protein